MSESIGLRIKELIECKKMSQSAFAKSIGSTQGTISSIIGKRGSSPSAELVASILEVYTEINPYWLLLGQGEMFLEHARPAPDMEARVATVESKIEDLYKVIRQALKNDLDDVEES